MPRIGPGDSDDSSSDGSSTSEGSQRPDDLRDRIPGGNDSDDRDDEEIDVSGAASSSSGSSSGQSSGLPGSGVSFGDDSPVADRRTGTSGSGSGGSSTSESGNDLSGTPGIDAVGDTPEDINQGRRSTDDGSSGGSSNDGSTSGPSTGGGPPTDLNQGRRSSSDGSDSGSSKSPSTDGAPDDLNQGRRSASEEGSTESDETGGSTANSGQSDGGKTNPDPSTPGSGDGSSGTQSSDSDGVQVESVNTSEQGVEEGQFEHLDETQRTEDARELEQRVIENTQGIDDSDEVRIVEDNGQLRAELTTQGESSLQALQNQMSERAQDPMTGRTAAALASAREGVREQVASQQNVDSSNVLVQFGEDGAQVSLTEEGRKQAQGLEAAAPQGGRREIQRSSVEERLAAGAGSAVETDEVSTRVEDGFIETSVQPTGGVTEIADQQGGLRDIQEDSAENRIADAAGDAVSADEVRVKLSDTDASVSISETAPTTADVGGGRREMQREQIRERVARQSEDVDANDLLVNVDEEGASVQLNDAARADRIRENVADEFDVVQEDEVSVEFGADGEAEVGLTEEGKRDRIQEQVASERSNVEADDVEVSFDESGDPEVDVAENFDDGGRFLGIAGGEEFVEDLSEPTDAFLGGVGEGAGTVVGAPLEVAADTVGLSSEEDTTVLDSAQAFGRGATTIFNPFAAAQGLDEAGEVIGASAGRLAGGAEVTSVGTGTPVVTGFEDGTVSSLEADFAESGGRVVSGFQRQARENPVQTTGMLAGSLVGSAAGIRAASASSRTAGRATAYAIQPGEELLTAGATRALSTTTRGARIVDSLPGGKVDIEEAGILAGRKAVGASQAAVGRVRRRLTDSVESPVVRGALDTSPVSAEVSTGGRATGQSAVDADVTPAVSRFRSFEGGGRPSPLELDTRVQTQSEPTFGRQTSSGGRSESEMLQDTLGESESSIDGGAREREFTSDLEGAPGAPTEVGGSGSGSLLDPDVVDARSSTASASSTESASTEATAPESEAGSNGSGGLPLRAEIGEAGGVRRFLDFQRSDGQGLMFDNRAQADLSFGRPRSDLESERGDSDPREFTDYSRSEVLEGSPRDRIQSDIFDRARRQRVSVESDGRSDVGGETGFSRQTSAAEVTRSIESRRRLAERSSLESESRLEASRGIEGTLLDDEVTADSALDVQAAVRPSLDSSVRTPAVSTGESVLERESVVQGAFQAEVADTALETRLDARTDTRGETIQEQRLETALESSLETELESEFESRRRAEFASPESRLGETESQPRELPSEEDPDTRSSRVVPQVFDSASEKWETGFEESEDAFADLFGGGR